MNRLNTIRFQYSKESDYKLPKTKKSPYIIDDSHFVPMSEAIKQLSLANASGSSVDMSHMYDFEDGKDNGMKIPITRTRDHDIAEISSEIRDQQKTITEKIQEQKDFNDKVNNFEKSLKTDKTLAKLE